MPDPVTPDAPAAPATPEPTPPTPPVETPPGTPATQPPAAPQNEDPMWDSMMAGLGMAVGQPAEPPKPPPEREKRNRTLAEVVVEESQRPATPPAPETPPATPPVTPPAQPAAAATPPVTPPVEPPKVEVERRPPVQQIVEQTVKKTLETLQPKPAEAPVAAPAPDPFEAQLTDAEKEELAFARYAAEKNPQFKDLPEKTLGYFKKAQGYIESALKENPDRSFDENDADWLKWRKQNAPPIHPGERKKLERAQIEDAAIERVRKENEGRFEQIQRQQRALEIQPAIEKDVAQHVTKIETQLADDEIVKDVLARAKEVGWEKAAQEDRIFTPIVKSMQDQSATMATEFKLLMAGVRQGDPNNPMHKWMLEFMHFQYQHYASDEKLRVRGNKTFLPRGEYFEKAKTDPATSQKHFTISEDEFLDLLASNTQQNIRNQVKTQNEALKASGFERKPRAAATTGTTKTETATPPPPPPPPPNPPPAAPPAAEHVSPRATVTSAPGAAKTTVTTPSTPGGEILSTYGIPLTR